RIAAAGAVNSLTQTLLRLTTPGIPDTYQGCDFWDFSLVDPDNRRPVDYATRRQALEKNRPLPELLAHWRDGRIKQALIARVLNFRKQHPDLFARGTHQPVPVAGPAAEHVIAFERRWKKERAVVVASRLAAGTARDLPLVPVEKWSDTSLRIGGGPWTEVLTGARVDNPRVATLLAQLPIAVLH
ncbi:MAG TPA: malto-oligosyltrehalose synthase, partial [Candidatus Binatia bacterium]|nr:malto-oligosyltrehalose synthase [Candidatus Binatia bacterium]